MRLTIRHILLGLAVASAISFSSCAENPPIPEDKMADMLSEYYLLNSALRHEKRETRETNADEYYAAFLDSFGVSAALFDSALAYYGARPMEYAEIYKVAIKKLEKKLDELNKQLEQ